MIYMRTAFSFIIFAAFAAQVWSAGKDKLRIATEGAYPPYNFINKQNKIDGFDADITSALCKAMERECELVAIAWVNIIDGLVEGKYDAVVAQMAKTPKREKVIDFTDHYSRSSTSFVGHANSGLGLTPDKISGKKLSTARATYQEEYLKKHYGKIASIVTHETIEMSMTALVKGNVDMVLTDSIFIFNFLKTDEGKDFDFIGKPLPADDPSAFAYIAVRKGDNKLKSALNDALKKIRLDGTFSRINNKYFPFSTY